MFPGTRFTPPHYYYEIGASTLPVSSGGDVNYNAKSPVPSGVTKLHWRHDYANNSSWTESSFPGYEVPDGYGKDGYNHWANNCLTNKIAKDLKIGREAFVNDTTQGYPFLGEGPATFVIEIPEDVAMGTKQMKYYNGYWYPQVAIRTGDFPYGSTIIIHNYGVLAGGGGLAGRGGGVYVYNTIAYDALGGGGGGGAGLHDWDLPFDVHEQGDNYGIFPLDADKTSGGPNPDHCFPGSGGTPSLQITVFSSVGEQAANGIFGPGNVVTTGYSSYANAGIGITNPTGITQAGTPAVAAVVTSAGSPGGSVFNSIGVNQTFLIYNHSTGKITSGGGGGGGGAGQSNEGVDGGAGGAPGLAGTAGESTGLADGGGAGGTAAVFSHDAFWDAGANQSKIIIKQNDGIIAGLPDDGFDVGNEY